MSKILTIDYETSDSRVNFGQVLQAGIVISDDKLKIQSTHELRCRLKPTVIPSIGACLVHKIPVNVLKNSNKSHYEMVLEHYTHKKSLTKKILLIQKIVFLKIQILES